MVESSAGSVTCAFRRAFAVWNVYGQGGYPADCHPVGAGGGPLGRHSRDFRSWNWGAVVFLPHRRRLTLWCGGVAGRVGCGVQRGNGMVRGLCLRKQERHHPPSRRWGVILPQSAHLMGLLLGWKVCGGEACGIVVLRVDFHTTPLCDFPHKVFQMTRYSVVSLWRAFTRRLVQEMKPLAVRASRAAMRVWRSSPVCFSIAARLGEVLRVRRLRRWTR
jgi:hypothetical protein